MGYRDDCRRSFINLGIPTLSSLYILENPMYVRENVDVREFKIFYCAATEYEYDSMIPENV